MKICTQCNQTLPLEMYDANKQGSQGKNSVCKACRKQERQSKQGVVDMMYSTQKVKSKQRGYLPPEYTKEELFTWLMEKPEFHEMYQGWVDSNYQSKFKPSCDRLNDLVSYRIDNLQVVTWNENSKKGYASQINGDNPKKNLAVDMLSMDGAFIQRFHSMSEAARHVNGRHGTIWGAINNSVVKNRSRSGGISLATRQSAYGYKWRYSTIPNDNTEIR